MLVNGAIGRDPFPDSCPVCAAACPGLESDAWRGLADPAHRRASAETIADHFGFCARHAAELRSDSWPAGLAAVAADALGATAAMLGDRGRYEERLVHLMFHAREACAACTVERRRTPLEPASLVAEARRLCLPHYEAVAARSDERQLAHFAAGALESARRWRARLGEDADDDAARAALAWLAGDALASATVRRIAFECPVCGAAQQALERWLAQLETGARLGMPLGGLLPLCPHHLAVCAQRCGARAVEDVARQASEAVEASLERGLAENARAVRLDREASTSVWYRRRAPSYLLGLRRRSLRLPRCGACERVDLACLRVQGRMLDLAARRSLPERGGELCLRHFGEVYMLCPHGEPRAALAARQRRALEGARAALAVGASQSAAAQLCAVAGS